MQIYIHIYVNMFYTHAHARAPAQMVRVDSWKFLLKKESFELDFDFREDGDIPQTGRQRIPDRWSNGTERTVAGFSTASRSMRLVVYSAGGSLGEGAAVRV